MSTRVNLVIRYLAAAPVNGRFENRPDKFHDLVILQIKRLPKAVFNQKPQTENRPLNRAEAAFLGEFVGQGEGLGCGRQAQNLARFGAIAVNSDALEAQLKG